MFFVLFLVVESNSGLQRAATLLFRLSQRLSFVQLQANKLLHALPVLHLCGAVGVILTWLAVRPLRLPHLLVHLGQSQSGGKRFRNRKWHININQKTESGLLDQQSKTSHGNNWITMTNKTRSPHSVTMSALAASTATVSGVFSSMSAAFWLAPLFRNRHTCLKRRRGNNVLTQEELKGPKQNTASAMGVWTNPVWPSMVAWWRGPRPWASCWFTLAAFCSRNSHVTSEPWIQTLMHRN